MITNPAVPEELYLWVCHDCKQDFLFRSDAEDHVRSEGHRQMLKYDLASLGGAPQRREELS